MSKGLVNSSDVEPGTPLAYPYASECNACDQHVVIDGGRLLNDDRSAHEC